MFCLNSIGPSQLAILANVIAIALSKDRDADEINVLGNLIAAIGCIMLTIAAQKQTLKSIQDKQNLKSIQDKQNK